MNRTQISALSLASSFFAFCMFTSVAYGDGPDWTQFDKALNISFPGYTGLGLTDFPVLIRLSPERNDFDYSRCANGDALRFSDSSGNLLSHEIDTWNPVGESLVWVKVPSLNSSTKIVAHYGYRGEGALPAVTASDVWDADYVGVWHLGEGGLPLAESSGVSTPFSESVGSSLAFGYAGPIGGALDLNNDGGRTGGVIAADDDDLDGFQSFTIEFWFRQTVSTTGAYGSIISKANSGTSEYSYRIYNDAGTKYKHFASTTGGAPGNPEGLKLSDKLSDITLQQWYHQALTFAFSDQRSAIYLDGTSIFNNASYWKLPNGVYAGSAPLCIGAGWTAGAAPFPGQIDELRISKAARSADWIKATHDTVANDAFASYEATDNDLDNYTHKFTVTFSGAPEGTLEDFPVLVKISEYDETTGKGIQDFSYADCLKANGGDMRFTDDAGNFLASEVDTWDPDGTSLIWVKVPNLTSSTKITAYYGWKMAPAADGAAVWSNGYVGVWHLNESTLPLAESSGVSTPFSTQYGAPTYGVSGAVGHALDMTSATSTWGARVNAVDDDDLDGFVDFTFEMWTKQDTWDSANNRAMLNKRGNYSVDNSYYWYNATDHDCGAGALFSTNGVQSIYVNGNSVRPEAGVWAHQAIVRDTVNRDAYSYINGEVSWHLGHSGGAEPMHAGSAQLQLGGSSLSYPFPGQIDEFRMSNVARSAAWIKATRDTVVEESFAAYSKALLTTRRTVIYFK